MPFTCPKPFASYSPSHTTLSFWFPFLPLGNVSERTVLMNRLRVLRSAKHFVYSLFLLVNVVKFSTKNRLTGVGAPAGREVSFSRKPDPNSRIVDDFRPCRTMRQLLATSSQLVTCMTWPSLTSLTGDDVIKRYNAHGVRIELGYCPPCVSHR